MPAEAMPWPDIVWSVAEGVDAGDPKDGEQAVAVAVGDEGFVAVGFRDDGPIRDGLIWFSPDGQGWTAVGAPGTLDGVELLDVAPGPHGFVALGVGSLGAAAERPHAVLFRSPDGRSWERLGDIPGSADTYPESLTGGTEGILAAGSDVDGAAVLWRSRDGRVFERLELDQPAADAITDPHAVADGYVALGSPGGPPILLRSTDAETWTASPIDAAADVVAARLVPGRWGYVVQGTWSAGCSPAGSCAGESIAWWSGDGVSWGRLPAADSPISNGGSIIVAAGDHGLLAIDGASAWESPDGWAWRPLPEPGDGSMVVIDAVVVGDVIVAVGASYGDDGTSRGAIVVAK